MISCSSTCFRRLYTRHQDVWLRFTACGFCPVVAVVMVESRVARSVHCAEDAACRQHPLHSAHILPPNSPASQQLQQDRNHGLWNAARHPDDGRKDAWNMSRNNRSPINHYLLHLVDSRLYLLIKDARSFEHKYIVYETCYRTNYYNMILE